MTDDAHERAVESWKFVEDAYDVIRERMAAGGPPWRPGKPTRTIPAEYPRLPIADE